MEIWKTFADGYEVSNLGNIRSLRRRSPHVLTLRKTRNGYLIVYIQVNNNRVIFSVHRLVAQMFIPNPDGKREVNHINGIKTDNRVENLEWVTSSENRNHAYATGLAPQGEAFYRAKLTNEQVTWCRNVYKPYDPNFGASSLARKMGISKVSVFKLLRGETYKTAGGKIHDVYYSRVPNKIRDEIRHLYRKKQHGFDAYSLAKQFGISHTTILDIVHEVHPKSVLK